MNETIETALFGAGCFWGVEDVFTKLPGVIETAVGYCGGQMEHPTYEDVCYRNTGHTEVVQVKFDPSKVSYKSLLHIFWENHNPTTMNRQGPDVGLQYRSVIFTENEAQEKIAEESKAALEKSKKWSKPIVTAIEPASTFWRAEEYHQKYHEKTGGSCKF